MDKELCSQTLAHNFHTARTIEVTKDTNESCKAFQVLIPRIPRASGMSVMALSSKTIRIGARIFLTLDFFRAAEKCPR